MLSLLPGVRLFVATQPVDGRKGADSLVALVRNELCYDPLTGHPFVFFSRRCDCVRVVYWDRDGFALWSKRLERGRYRPSFSSDGRTAGSGDRARGAVADPGGYRAGEGATSTALGAEPDADERIDDNRCPCAELLIRILSLVRLRGDGG